MVITFSQLFEMYCQFMESNELRHQDLIGPIKGYANGVGIKYLDVLAILKSLYVKA